MPIDTQIYSSLGQNNQAMSPLQVLQLLGQVNQNKLFNQTYDSRQKIGQAYQNNVDQNGKINNSGLMKDIAGAGFLAPEAAGQAINNSTAQFGLDTNKLQFAQKTLGALASNPNVKSSDVAGWAANAARAGVDPETIHGVLNDAYKSGGDPKALRKALAGQAIMSMGTGALEGEAGPPVAGTPTTINKGEAILRRAGALPAQDSTGMIVSNPPGYENAAAGIGAQSAASANSLSQANDTSMTRKGMLGNLEEDLTKFTSGPAADWAKLAKAWVNRNVPKPKGWEFDPGSIASQEQFNKQSAMLAQQQFEAIGGTGTDAKFNSAFTTSPNEVLSDLGNKGIIRLLKGNEDAIQAKNKAWQGWQRQGNGPQTYPQFSAQFNESFDPRAFQFKYIPEKDRQSYVDKMDDDERMQFLKNLTMARKQGWINYQQPKSQ